MKLIPRHLIGTFIPPFFFGLSVTTFLLMIDVLERYINLFLEKGIHIGVATEVLFLSLGHTFALSIPMAVLVGTLMSMGHLASDNEITAMKAAGVSLYRIARPLLIAGTLIALGMMAYNNFVLPVSNHRLRNLLTEIHRMRPALTIKENTFAEINEHYTVFMRAKDDKSGRIDDVVLYKREERGDPAPDVIVAEYGMLRSTATDRIELDLFNGQYHSMPDPTEPMKYHLTDFRRQTFTIDTGPDSPAASVRRGEREMNVSQLKATRAEKIGEMNEERATALSILREVVLPAYDEITDNRPEPPPGRTAVSEYRAILNKVERHARSVDVKFSVVENYRVAANKFGVELHKKFSIPVACIVFVLLGVPLSIVTARGGKGVSMGMSLATFLVYYLFLTGGEKLSDRGLLEPWISMWAANVILGVSGLFLLYQSVQETRVVTLSSLRGLWPFRRGPREPQDPVPATDTQ